MTGPGEQLGDGDDSGGVSIRALDPGEWEAYRRLRLEMLQLEPQAFGTPFAEARQQPDILWRKRLEDVGSKQGAWMVFAEKRGALVGMAASYSKEAGVVEVISVYVRASERGRGISRRLMEAILRQITSDPDVQTVTLTVNKDQSAAVGLYTSLGFTITGEVRATMGDGRLHDEYNMAIAADNAD